MKILSIGRAPDNDVVINDKMVSGKHLAIVLDENLEYWAEDLASTNGTFINGNRLSKNKTKLNPNDTIKIGETVLNWQNYFLTGY
jgi:pSer/pThr/pTyr-binding forkhead associated (FHA) protein